MKSAGVKDQESEFMLFMVVSNDEQELTEGPGTGASRDWLEHDPG